MLIKPIIQDFLQFKRLDELMFQRSLNPIQILIIYLIMLKFNVCHLNLIYFLIKIWVHSRLQIS